MACSHGRVIVGLSCADHDTSAAVLVDGVLQAACEQERYTLDKHSTRFPKDALNDALAIAGVRMDQVDEIAVGFDFMAYIRETYLAPAVGDPRRLKFLIGALDRVRHLYTYEDWLRQELSFAGTVAFHRHHLCHMASAYYASGFPDALLYSIDGRAECETGMIGIGRGGAIEVVDAANRNPHSLGLLYGAVTDYLGWKKHCDEGIVMGLAPFGNPDAAIPGTTTPISAVFAEIVRESGDFQYTIDQSWFDYYYTPGRTVSDKFFATFGPPRGKDQPIADFHRNMAAALQRRLEEVVLAQLRRARARFGVSKLCLAGGVALNCSMNGRILAEGIFDEIFVVPAAGDNGVSIGACYLSHVAGGGAYRPEKRQDFYLGSPLDAEAVPAAFERHGLPLKRADDICALTAEKLAAGKIVAWFQGRAEFGPRALGNRSILTRPYPAEMKDVLNARVKFREAFRPFAPAVLREHAGTYFDIDQDSPHMLMAVQVRPEMAGRIPAVVHVDGTARVQTVTPQSNARFHDLLVSFHRLTGCPVILNTSFNVKGQPIVNTAEQAVDTFMSTNIDFLAIGDFYAEKAG